MKVRAERTWRRNNKWNYLSLRNNEQYSKSRLGKIGRVEGMERCVQYCWCEGGSSDVVRQKIVSLEKIQKSAAQGEQRKTRTAVWMKLSYGEASGGK